MAVRFNCRRSSCAQHYKNGFREDQIWPQLVKTLLVEHEQIASLLLGQAAAADRQSPSPDAEAMARLTEQRAQLMDLQQQGLPVADALRAVEREVAAVKSAAIAGQSKSAMAIAQLGQEILGDDAGANALMEAVLVQALQEPYPAVLQDEWTAALVRACTTKVVIDHKQITRIELVI